MAQVNLKNWSWYHSSAFLRPLNPSTLELHSWLPPSTVSVESKIHTQFAISHRRIWEQIKPWSYTLYNLWILYIILVNRKLPSLFFKERSIPLVKNKP
jgi:hypothetical protein